jgi:hypothetical protein
MLASFSNAKKPRRSSQKKKAKLSKTEKKAKKKATTSAKAASQAAALAAASVDGNEGAAAGAVLVANAIAALDDAELAAVTQECNDEGIPYAKFIPRPISSYLYWVTDYRVILKHDYPGANVAEKNRLIVEAWSQVKNRVPKKYTDLADVDTRRYHRETDAQKALLEAGELARRPPVVRSVDKKPVGVPKPVGSFMTFLCQHLPHARAVFPGLTMQTMAKRMSRAWRALAPEQRAPYEQVASMDARRYSTLKDALYPKEHTKWDLMDRETLAAKAQSWSRGVSDDDDDDNDNGGDNNDDDVDVDVDAVSAKSEDIALLDELDADTGVVAAPVPTKKRKKAAPTRAKATARKKKAKNEL